MRCAAGDAPQKEAVDGPARQFATFGARAGSRHVVEDPGNLRGGKIRIEEKTGPRLDHRLGAFSGELCAFVGRSAVLPDDSTVDRLPSLPVPHHHGFALVGNPNGGDAYNVGGAQRLSRYRNSILPDLLGLVLDMPWCRIMLLNFTLYHGDGASLGIEQNRTRRSRALVDRQHMILRPHRRTI